MLWIIDIRYQGNPLSVNKNRSWILWYFSLQTQLQIMQSQRYLVILYHEFSICDAIWNPLRGLLCLLKTIGLIRCTDTFSVYQLLMLQLSFESGMCSYQNHVASTRCDNTMLKLCRHNLICRKLHLQKLPEPVMRCWRPSTCTLNICPNFVLL